MAWQISLVILYFCMVAQALWQRSYSQKSSLPESYPPALSYILGVTPLGILVGLFIPHSIHWNALTITLVALEGLFIGLFNVFAFMAIKRMPMAQFQTIFQSNEL